MCCASIDDSSIAHTSLPNFEDVQAIVESEFDVTESFVEHGIPTFHISYRATSKEAFMKISKRLESNGLIPLLRQREEKVVLKILSTPPSQPNRIIVNIALFFATLGTVFISGYFQSADILGALLFTGAIMAILGSHEMGHKLLANKH